MGNYKINFFKALSFIFPTQCIITTGIFSILLIFGESEEIFSTYSIFYYVIFHIWVFILSLLFYFLAKKPTIKLTVYFIGLILISFLILFLNLNPNKTPDEILFLIILNFIGTLFIITSIYKTKIGAILGFIFLIILFILGGASGEGGLVLVFLSVILLPYYFAVLVISKKFKKFFAYNFEIKLNS